MRSIFTLVAAFGLSACATVPTASIRGDGLAHLGQATRVGALIVTPRAIIEDSRCPINARCIWAGRAVIRADVARAGRRKSMRLTLGERVATHGTTLALTSVEPGKMAGAQPFPRQPILFGFEGGR